MSTLCGITSLVSIHQYQILFKIELFYIYEDLQYDKDKHLGQIILTR